MSKAARELSACLRKVCEEHESFELVKRGVPCAHLLPIEKPSGTTHDLADALDSAALSPQDRRGWRAAIAEGRERLKPLRNPWG